VRPWPRRSSENAAGDPDNRGSRRSDRLARAPENVAATATPATAPTISEAAAAIQGLKPRARRRLPTFAGGASAFCPERVFEYSSALRASAETSFSSPAKADAWSSKASPARSSSRASGSESSAGSSSRGSSRYRQKSRCCSPSRPTCTRTPRASAMMSLGCSRQRRARRCCHSNFGGIRQNLCAPRHRR
jgi:hypothetical protein